MPFKNGKGNSELIPFHILTIKNASLSTENNISYLRINFHVPGQGISKEVQLPNLKSPGSIFVKEITLKSGNSFILGQALKQIKELLKSNKMEEQAKSKSADAPNREEEYVASESLITAK